MPACWPGADPKASPPPLPRPWSARCRSRRWIRSRRHTCIKGDPVAGKKVFLTAGCTGCHTLKDAGSTGTVGPNLDVAQPTYRRATARVTNGKNAMPSFKSQLTTQQIADVAAYVVKATGGTP